MADKKTPVKRVVARPKQEMLEAYREALPPVEERREAESKPEETLAERAAKKMIETADAVSIEGVLKEVAVLKAEMAKVLSGLTDRLDQEVGKYAAVKTAVTAKEQELQEVFEIQKAASTLAALLEAQARRREEFEVEMAEKKDALLREIEGMRAQWAEEKARRQVEVQERDAALAKAREREKEEYEYAVKRERQVARDRFEAEKTKLTEEKTKLEQEIQLKREQLTKELAERELAVRQSEVELEELRRKAAAFPKELETAVAREAKATTERVRAEASAREELLRKEFEGERNVLKTRIAALEAGAKEQAEQITRLSHQLEKSYSQIQDIAVKAIQGSSPLRAFSGPQAPMGEGTRSQSQERA